MNRFDKPFRVLPSIDIKKGLELFNIASKLDTHELLQYSLVNQIPLGFVNEDGECLIHEVINIDPKRASEHAKLNVIKFLVQNKVNPDSPNKYNQTPLHLACSQQLNFIVKYLLELHVNPNFQDNMGLTPFHYLLTGRIKTVDTSSEILDFVPPPKKQDVDLIKQTLEIKQEIWKMIQSDSMLATIKNTLDNILIEDPDIVTRQIETKSLITKLALDTQSTNKLPEIKQNIELTRKTISDKINAMFKGFADLNEFKIHTKEPNSWSPNDTQLGLIVNGRIKNVIRSELKKIGEIINNLANEFKPYVNVPTDYHTNGYEEVYSSQILDTFKAKFVDSLAPDPDGNQIYHLDVGFRYNPASFEKIFDTLRHKLAYDNASSIINFEKLKYAGGSRLLTPEIIDADRVATEFKELFDDAILAGEEKQILYLLGTPLSMDTINGLTNDQLNNIINTFGSAPFADIDGVAVDDQLKRNIAFYIILAYTAIVEPYNFDKIKSFSTIIDTYGGPNSYTNNKFAQKWFNIRNKRVNEKTFDLGSWVFHMYCDLMCVVSQSNLECNIPFRLLALTAGLKNHSTSKIQGVANIYKPQIIGHILQQHAAGPDPAMAFTKFIVLLLDDSVTKEKLDIITRDTDADTSWINEVNMKINSDIKSFAKLIYLYLSNPDPNNFINNVNTDPTNNNIKQYYNQYNLSLNPIDNLCKIFLSLYNQLNNKPMKQTILDTIYYLKNFHKDPDQIQNIATNMLYPVVAAAPPAAGLVFDTEINQQPSLYGVINYNTDVSLGSYYHLQIAHIMGLYFEGMIDAINIDPNSLITFNNRVYAIIEVVVPVVGVLPPPPPPTHVYNDGENKLDARQLPFLMNYIKLGAGNELNMNGKLDYYDIKYVDIKYRPPTWFGYFMMLIKNIQSTQNVISELVIKSNNIINGFLNNTKYDLKTLFLEYYPKILANCKILDNAIESYNEFKNQHETNPIWRQITLNRDFQTPSKYKVYELAKSLNKINSYYYLYYYLFSPSKLIKLSRFNYYQIPIDKPSRYYYYSTNVDTTDANITINDPTDPLPVPVRVPVRVPVPVPVPVLAPVPVPTRVILSASKLGFVNNFSLGFYDKHLNEYLAGNYITDRQLNDNSYVRLKTVKLPPSLYNVLDVFYKYALIELTIKIIEKIKADPPAVVPQTLLKKIQSIVKSQGVYINEYDLSYWLFICKIVQELVKDQINVYIGNSVLAYFKNYIGNDTAHKLNLSQLFTTKEMSINLTSTSINLQSAKLNYINMYSLVVKPMGSNTEPFILYPNDFSNINRLRSKYGVIINDKIIETLFQFNASPFINNFDGISPIYPIIKNYNFELVEKIKKLGVDYRNFDGESPINFIKKENLNNLDKILTNYNQKDPIKNLLKNIDGYLYNDIQSLITSNDAFGNNVLVNLSESFNIVGYLTLHYLSQFLTVQNNPNLEKLNEITTITNSKYNTNFLAAHLEDLEVPDNISYFILEQIIEDKKEEIKKINKEINTINKEYTLSHTNKLTVLNNEIKQLNKILKGFFVGFFPNNTINPNQGDIMEDYKSIANNNYRLGMVAWQKLLNNPIEIKSEIKSELNPNLLPIYLLEKQKTIIEKINLTSLTDLVTIIEPIKQLSTISEYYFITNKYTDINSVLKFIDQMLNYVCKIVIGNGIELMMRRILLTWLQNAQPQPKLNFKEINEIINFILDDNLTGLADEDGKPMSMLSQLYDNICPKFVTNSVEIFANKSEEQGHNSQTIKEILLNYFILLDNSPKPIPDEIRLIFKKEVTNYFDTFISKTILLWYVNVENILKFNINNYRCLETLNKLVQINQPSLPV